VALHDGEAEFKRVVVAVLSKASHRGVFTGHAAGACDLTANGATKGGVVREEAGLVYSPHEFLLMCEFYGTLDKAERACTVRKEVGVPDF
jgi:hypothetical protein